MSKSPTFYDLHSKIEEKVRKYHEQIKEDHKRFEVSLHKSDMQYLRGKEVDGRIITYGTYLSNVIDKLKKYKNLFVELEEMFVKKASSMNERAAYILSKSRILNKGGSPKKDYEQVASEYYSNYENNIRKFKNFMYNAPKTILESNEGKLENLVIIYKYLQDIQIILSDLITSMIELKDYFEEIYTFYEVAKEKNNVLKKTTTKEREYNKLLATKKSIDSIVESHGVLKHQSIKSAISDVVTYVDNEMHKIKPSLAEKLYDRLIHYIQMPLSRCSSRIKTPKKQLGLKTVIEDAITEPIDKKKIHLAVIDYLNNQRPCLINENTRKDIIKIINDAIDDTDILNGLFK